MLGASVARSDATSAGVKRSGESGAEARAVLSNLWVGTHKWAAGRGPSASQFLFFFFSKIFTYIPSIYF